MNYLFIDGFNAMHAWPQMKSLLLKKRADAACALLIETVRIIHDIDGMQVAIVFDGKGERLSVEHPSNEATFSVIYSPSNISADGVIEFLVRRVKSAKDCTVVSRDNMVVEASRAAGAIAITPQDLIDWVKRSQAQSRILIQRKKKQNQTMEKGEGPWDKLDALS